MVRGPEAAQPRTHGALLFVLALGLIAAVGMLYLLQTSAVANQGRELSRLQRQINAEAVRNEELSYQLAYYESLPVVERIALERGMQPMESSIFLSVPLPGDVVTASETGGGVPDRSTAERLLDRMLGRGEAGDDTGASTP